MTNSSVVGDTVPVTAAAARVLRVGVRLGVVAVAVQTVAHLVDFAFFDLEIEMIRAETDTGAFAWLSTAVTACAALLCFLIGITAFRAARAPVVAAAITAFLSLDDMVQIHERVSAIWQNLGLPERLHLARLIWPLIFFPLFALLAVLLWRLSASLGRDFRRLIVAGLALLVAAVGLEAASPVLFWLDFGHETWPYEIEVVLEEGCELLGWSLIATGLAGGLVQLLQASPDPVPTSA